MLYPLAASSHVCTDPRQLRAPFSCSLCSSIPPPSRILQPQLTQVLLHHLLPLDFGQCPKALAPLRWKELLDGGRRTFCLVQLGLS